MPIANQPEWQQLAIYAVAAGVLLTLLFSIPRIGGFIRGAFSLAILVLAIFVFLQQAPLQPGMARVTEMLGISSQEIAGDEVRIRMSSDGHFWANATINGQPRRMLIDSGATVTAVSEQTAQAAALDRDANVLPVMLRTANGTVRAGTSTVDSLTLGGIEATNLKVVVSPALGPVDILGMNFLSSLASWRVEGQTLILVPKQAGPPAPT